jgi:FMN-dependent NADH-azoreductase
MKLLYINACVRRESRTNRIAKALISKITGAYAGAAGAASGAAGTVTDSTGADADSFIVEERTLDTLGLQPLNEERLNRRTELIEAQAWNAPVFDLAKQFAAADIIVISAPYWDGSFPALLKLYLENIYVTGIVSRYGENGQPCGMCRAQKLFYVTTAGGPYKADYSYAYLQDLALHYFGIAEIRLIKAEMLDVDGFDAEAIVEQTIREGLDI